MDDLISRRDAKSKQVYSHERHEYVVPVAELDWLPPAQPEQIARDIATIIENERDMRVLNAPSAQPEIPEIIRCKDCKYAEVADKEDRQDGYTCQFHRGSIWFSGSYCSWAERRQDADSSGNMSGTQKELKRKETHSCDSERTETHDSRREWYMKGYRDAQPRWISVEEALPEDDKRVLCQMKGGELVFGFHHGKYWAYGHKPIAWFPLPEPYKEGTE